MLSYVCCVCDRIMDKQRNGGAFTAFFRSGSSAQTAAPGSARIRCISSGGAMWSTSLEVFCPSTSLSSLSFVRFPFSDDLTLSLSLLSLSFSCVCVYVCMVCIGRSLSNDRAAHSVQQTEKEQRTVWDTLHPFLGHLAAVVQEGAERVRCRHRGS